MCCGVCECMHAWHPMYFMLAQTTSACPALASHVLSQDTPTLHYSNLNFPGHVSYIKASVHVRHLRRQHTAQGRTHHWSGTAALPCTAPIQHPVFKPSHM